MLAVSLLLLLQGLPPDVVRALIERLGSDAPAERMEAERRLEDAGAGALPALREAGESPDAEVSARAGRLLRIVPVTSRVSAALRRAMPGALPRILAGEPGEWTQVFLEATERGRDGAPEHGGLRAEDLAPLVEPALRAASDQEAVVVLARVPAWGIRSAAGVIPDAIRGRAASVRAAGLWALRECGARETLPVIRAGLFDPASEVRGAAAHALIGLEGNAAAGALVPLLHPLNPGLQRTAADALRRLPIPVTMETYRAAFRALDAPGRESLVPLLAEAGQAQAVPVLAELLSDRDADLKVSAIRALVGLEGRDAGRALVAAFDDAHPRVREAAARAAGSLAIAAAVPGLARLLGDLAAPVRRASAESLGLLGAREAAPHLAELLYDPDDSVRQEAGTALVTLEALGEAESVRRCLESTRAEVRVSALEVLSGLGDRGSLREILGLLRDAEAEPRRAAARALGELGSREAVPGLSAALRDAEDSVVREALDSLGRLGARSEAGAVAALLVPGRESLWEDAVATLGALGAREQRAAVAGALDAADARAVRAAVLVLEEFEAREELPRLRSLLAHGSAAVRVEAAFALASLGSAEGVDVLLRAGDRLSGLNGIRQPEAWRRLRRGPVRDPAPDEEDGFLEEAMESLSLRVEWDAALWPESRRRIARMFYRCPSSSAALALEWNALQGDYGVVLEDDRVRLLTRDDALRFWKKAFGRTSAPGETVVER